MEKATILVVEDDDLMAEYLKTVLIRQGYLVSGVASTEEEAVKMARETCPDIVLMDIKLTGDVDGIVAAERIKEFSEIPIVFVSAYSKLIARALRAKPSGFITKPFTAEGLIRKVEIALSGYKMIGLG